MIMLNEGGQAHKSPYYMTPCDQMPESTNPPVVKKEVSGFPSPAGRKGWNAKGHKESFRSDVDSLYIIILVALFQL